MNHRAGERPAWRSCTIHQAEGRGLVDATVTLPRRARLGLNVSFERFAFRAVLRSKVAQKRVVYIDNYIVTCFA